MDVLIEVEHDVEDGTGAQRTRVVSGARSNLSQMLLQRVFMDVERVGCAGDGPIVLEEAFPRCVRHRRAPVGCSREKSF